MERIEKQPFIREEMRIPDVTKMDGLVSLMGRSMDNEESFHIDLLLSSLSRLHPFVKKEDVERMVPVFEMARTVVEGGKDGTKKPKVNRYGNSLRYPSTGPSEKPAHPYS